MKIYEAVVSGNGFLHMRVELEAKNKQDAMKILKDSGYKFREYNVKRVNG